MAVKRLSRYGVNIDDVVVRCVVTYMNIDDVVVTRLRPHEY